MINSYRALELELDKWHEDNKVLLFLWIGLQYCTSWESYKLQVNEENVELYQEKGRTSN